MLLLGPLPEQDLRARATMVRMETPTPLLLDVDTGVDDAIALLLAVADPRADLVAVSCCAGNVEAPQAGRNSLAVLELAGADGVEVAVGSEAPLAQPLRTATSHGPSGLGYARLPEPRSAPSPRFGPDAIVTEARRRPGQLLLVATGPLTNVALALRREPELPRLLRRLAVMGGAFERPGNTTSAAEFNVGTDPEAASEVLAAFAGAATRPLVAGLNVTETVELDAPRIASLGGGPVARFVADALQVKLEAADDGAHMHDPLALALALDPSLGTTRAARVEVVLAGARRGMTVADWRPRPDAAANADVAVGVDAERFLDLLVERLSALDAERAGMSPL